MPELSLGQLLYIAGCALSFLAGYLLRMLLTKS
jgi:hypothetical protein